MKQTFLHFTPLIFALLLTGCIEPVDILPDIVPPSEVKELYLEKSDIDVSLTWVDPTDVDFKGIRITLYNASNQNVVTFTDVPPDSMAYTFKRLSSGDYYVKLQTRDKENNLSAGIDSSFVFLSMVPGNVRNISSAIYWNVLHLDWDSLTVEDFDVTVSGQTVSVPVDSIIVEVDNLERHLYPVTATGAVIPDLPDGPHSVRIMTHSGSGYYSAEYTQSFAPITFGEKFVRVNGNGYDFYIARYEVTTEEYRKFVVDDLGISVQYAPYYVDNSKVEADASFKWWYGTNPAEPGTIYLMGFNSWEFSLTPENGWVSNKYDPESAFGKATWEGAMLYCLVNYNGRCPTQDEWLYAASGGPLSNGYDYAGSNDPDEVGWWGWTSGYPVFLEHVGQKTPNELGIYDMSGNAGEYLYELDPVGSTLGQSVIIGGSMGPIHFWSNEGEDFAPDNNIKPRLTDPEIVKHTGKDSWSALWRMGIRVLIPHDEIVKLPMNRFKYEK